MVQINAASRLVAAEAAWWTNMPDNLKNDYVQDHPNSKYAKGWKSGGEENPLDLSKQAQPLKPAPSLKMAPGLKVDPKRKRVEPEDDGEALTNPDVDKSLKPKGDRRADMDREALRIEQEEFDREAAENMERKGVKAPSKKAKPATKPKPKPAQPKAKQWSPQDLAERMQQGRPGSTKRTVHEFKAKLKAMPEATQQFVAKALDNPTGSAVKDTFKDASAAAGVVVKGFAKDVKSSAVGASGALKILTGKKPSAKEAKGLMTSLFNICAIGALGVVGGMALGPSLVAFAAAKYMVLPFLKHVAKEAFYSARDVAKGPGIWTADQHFVPFTQKELDAMSDEEFYRIAEHNADGSKSKHHASVVIAGADAALDQMMQKLLAFSAQNMTKQTIANSVFDTKGAAA